MSVSVNKNNFYKNEQIRSFAGFTSKLQMKYSSDSQTKDTLCLQKNSRENKSKQNFITKLWNKFKNIVGLKTSSKNQEQIIEPSNKQEIKITNGSSVKHNKNITFCGSYNFKEAGYGHGEYSVDDELGWRIYEDGVYAEVSEFPNGTYLSFDDGTNVFEHKNGDVEIDGELVHKEESETRQVQETKTTIKEFKTLPTEPVSLVVKKDGKDCTVIIMPSAFKKMTLDKFNAYIEAVQRGFKTSGTGIKGTTRNGIFEIRTSPNGLYGDTRIMGYFDQDTGTYIFERYCDHKGADAYIYSKKL